MSHDLAGGQGDRQAPAGFQINRAQRLDEALAIMRLRTNVYSVSSSGSGEICDFRTQHRYFANIGVSLMSYRKPVTVQAHGTVKLELVWAVAGAGLLRTGRRERMVSPGCGAIAVPGQAYGFSYAEDTVRAALMLEESLLEQHLAAATGLLPRGRIRLQPEFQMSAGAGAALVRLTHFIIAELGQPDSILTNPGAVAGLRDAIVTTLLQQYPHSHSHLFETVAKAEGPAVVRRVEDFLRARALDAVSMADLPAVAGIGLRSIQASFRKHRGYSPNEFLRSVRLAGAHERLKSGEVARVIDVAYECGFAKLSRFSADYLRRFGELPSATLRRARGREALDRPD